MKLFLEKKKITNILKERGKSVKELSTELDVSVQEMYIKIKGASGLSIKQLNKLCFFLLIGAESVLTEESLEELEEYRKDLEYMDTLNTNY